MVSKDMWSAEDEELIPEEIPQERAAGRQHFGKIFPELRREARGTRHKMCEGDHQGRIQTHTGQTHQHKAAHATARVEGRLEGPMLVQQVTVRQGSQHARHIDGRHLDPAIDAREPGQEIQRAEIDPRIQGADGEKLAELDQSKSHACA